MNRPVAIRTAPERRLNLLIVAFFALVVGLAAQEPPGKTVGPPNPTLKQSRPAESQSADPKTSRNLTGDWQISVMQCDGRSVPIHIARHMDGVENMSSLINIVIKDDTHISMRNALGELHEFCRYKLGEEGPLYDIELVREGKSLHGVVARAGPKLVLRLSPVGLSPRRDARPRESDWAVELSYVDRQPTTKRPYKPGTLFDFLSGFGTTEAPRDIEGQPMSFNSMLAAGATHVRMPELDSDLINRYEKDWLIKLRDVYQPSIELCKDTISSRERSTEVHRSLYQDFARVAPTLSSYSEWAGESPLLVDRLMEQLKVTASVFQKQAREEAAEVNRLSGIVDRLTARITWLEHEK
ncbi:MAG: hypothetical protein P4L85_18490 [Paludisphaera borealis]|uniref:hypothetical protein n=1 Tax=Paludisphaera borealis TaxID=1387353 RepID=UPI00284F454D|nr:hypothetical protein [Paludisphaera borealis]MDR3621346.1 hypothetical protein [Paludisphaera borealis]